MPYSNSFNVNTWTASAWINLAANASSNVNGIIGTRFGGDSTVDMKIQNGNTLFHTDIGNGNNWLNTSADAAYTFNPGTWYMVTETVTSNGYSLYVNGTSIGSGPVGGTPLFMQSGPALDIGQSYVGEFFHGSLDDVYIYGRASAGQR